MHCTYLRSFFSVLFYFLLSNQYLINQDHQRIVMIQHITDITLITLAYLESFS